MILYRPQKSKYNTVRKGGARMNYLSLDVGTTCCKCQLFSEEGDILLYRSEEYPLAERDGEKYVDIESIWSIVQSLMLSAARAGGYASVCISTFGESFVLLDKEDKILFYPMLYTDPRGEEEAEEILKKCGAEQLYGRVGVLPQSMFSLPKLLWIKKHAPEAFARADKLMLICDYLGYLLTGERAIDYGLASRTGAFNLNSRTFDGEVLSAFGVNASLFSRPMPAGSVVGLLKNKLRALFGLEQDVTLVLGSHDQICSALGAGAVRAGDAVDGLGTVECITPVFDGICADVRMGQEGYPLVPYAVPGLYCTYMFNYSSGLLVNWFKNALLHGYKGEEESFFTYIEKGMREGPTGILTLPYFAGAATPYQNINAKGAMLNLTVSATDSDVYKSILEGTAMEMRLNAETVKRYGIRIRSAVATGGGANSEAWLQLKADIQNIPFRTLRSSEGGLCGCAMLQAAAAGAAKDLAEAANIFVQYAGEYLPDKAAHAAYGEQYRRYKKIYRTVKEFY